MIFTSYIPALDVLTTQLDSLSKPSRPHNVKNFCCSTFAEMQRYRLKFISLKLYLIYYKTHTKNDKICLDQRTQEPA